MLRGPRPPRGSAGGVAAVAIMAVSVLRGRAREPTPGRAMRPGPALRRAGYVSAGARARGVAPRGMMQHAHTAECPRPGHGERWSRSLGKRAVPPYLYRMVPKGGSAWGVASPRSALCGHGWVGSVTVCSTASGCGVGSRQPKAASNLLESITKGPGTGRPSRATPEAAARHCRDREQRRARDAGVDWHRPPGGPRDHSKNCCAVSGSRLAGARLARRLPVIGQDQQPAGDIGEELKGMRLVEPPGRLRPLSGQDPPEHRVARDRASAMRPVVVRGSTDHDPRPAIAVRAQQLGAMRARTRPLRPRAIAGRSSRSWPAPPARPPSSAAHVERPERPHHLRCSPASSPGSRTATVTWFLCTSIPATRE